MSTPSVKRSSLMLATILVATTATAANNAEQVVFSTPGFVMDLVGNSHGSQTPFGFWIWCIAEPAPNGGGPYQEAQACQGSMYFYALDHNATHVIGFSEEDPVTEGIYTMTVLEGRLPELLDGSIFTNADYGCRLTNILPGGKGRHGNSVEVECAFSPALGGGFGSAVVPNAVVNVTGP
jgi:hypothetical protein